MRRNGHHAGQNNADCIAYGCKAHAELALRSRVPLMNSMERICICCAAQRPLIEYETEDDANMRCEAMHCLACEDEYVEHLKVEDVGIIYRLSVITYL